MTVKLDLLVINKYYFTKSHTYTHLCTLTHTLRCLFRGHKQKQSLPTISSSGPALFATQKTERPEIQGAETPWKTRRQHSKMSET